MILPPAALRALTWRKFKGFWRKQLRRARTPKGALLGLLGLGLGAIYVGYMLLLFVGPGRHLRGGAPPVGELRDLVRGTGLIIALLQLTSAFGTRGLYIPVEEIEKLLSAPVSRADLVRYRLWVGGLRSLAGSVFLGGWLASIAPVAGCGFAAGLLGLATLGVAGQGLSIAAGGFERKLYDRWLRKPLRVAGLLVLVLGAALAWYVFSRRDAGEGSELARSIARGLPNGRLSGLLHVEPLRTLTLPLAPWAELAAAPSWLAALPWLAACLAIYLASIELVARLPVDFRELSLETSANVAERMRRARRGGSAATSASASFRRIPWLFGRGPFGAIAWRKLVSMLRKARGTVLLLVMVVLLISYLASSLDTHGNPSAGLMRATMVAALGTMYLCGGLRFDFREDLDRLDVIKTWPVSPWTVFGATLLPEWLLVTGLLEVALIGLGLYGGDLGLQLLPLLLGLPLVTALYISLDNIVFLFSPTRYVPGQEGMLQNAGRALVMMLARIALLAAVGGSLLLAYWGTSSLSERALGLPPLMSGSLGFAAALGVGLVFVASFVFLGGWLLSRYDVARDKS